MEDVLNPIGEQVAPPQEVTWDYKGWDDGRSYAFYAQSDWNNTLLTVINLESAILRKKLRRDETVELTVGLTTYAILADFPFYNPTYKMLNGMKVIYDETETEDIIKLSGSGEQRIIRIVNY
jgi:hypothetical protein